MNLLVLMLCRGPVPGLWSPTGPPSIREVSMLIRSWQDFRVHFYDWLDDFYGFPEERERMVRDEIVPVWDCRLEAFMAAAVHHLCLRHGTPVPPWMNDERYVLLYPWFYPGEVSVRAIEFVESPGAFRARNIFTFAEVLDRC